MNVASAWTDSLLAVQHSITSKRGLKRVLTVAWSSSHDAKIIRHLLISRELPCLSSTSHKTPTFVCIRSEAVKLPLVASLEICTSGNRMRLSNRPQKERDRSFASFADNETKLHSTSCEIMATPTDFVPTEQWRLPIDPSPTYRAAPMLPRIASLLTGPDNKRKREDLPTYHDIQASPAPVYSPSARAVYQQLEPRATDSSLYVDPPRRPTDERRLYYHHSDPHEIHEIHIQNETSPRYEHVDLSRKHSRYQCTYQEETVQKRRRVHSPPQHLYEPEYGLTVLETSKALMHSRYFPRMESEAAASRHRYVRDSEGFEKVTSPRLTYNSERSFRSSVIETPRIETPAPRTPVNVEKRETSPLTTLVLKSKEFLKSKSLVRNRHDEIDWVATFLKVGFDSSSIYALMCPLRKGRWKSEEENYTMGLLRLIENGTILLRHGQSIRGYIGEKLHSDDMRVLKKLSNCKMFHFAKLINPRLAEEEKLDMSVAGAREGLDQLDQLKGEFLRSVQLEALVAVRKYLSDSSLRDLLNVRA